MSRGPRRRFILPFSRTAIAGFALAAGLVVPVQTASAAPASLCAQFGNMSVASGGYRVQNNLWNPAPGARQCLRVENTRFDVTVAESVRPTNGAPASYPSIYKGCHYTQCTAKSGFPQRVNAMKNVRVSWNTRQPAVGTYNVSLDVWFAANPKDPDENDGELMVWLARRGPIQPIGVLKARKKIGGVDYEVWASEKTRKPQVVTYVRTKGVSAVNGLSVRDLTRDARSRGYFSDSWHLTSVQAGFEIWRGGVGLRTNSFTVATG